MMTEHKAALQGARFIGRAYVDFEHEQEGIVSMGVCREDIYAAPDGSCFAHVKYPNHYPWDREEIMTMDPADEVDIIIDAVSNRWNLPLRVWMAIRSFLQRIFPW